MVVDERIEHLETCVGVVGTSDYRGRSVGEFRWAASSDFELRCPGEDAVSTALT